MIHSYYNNISGQNSYSEEEIPIDNRNNLNSLFNEINNNMSILNNIMGDENIYINPTFHINRSTDEYERLMRLDETIVKKGIKIDKFSVEKESEDEFTCPICFDNFPKKTKILEFKCTHSFCEECSEEWFKENTKCPVCSFKFVE